MPNQPERLTEADRPDGSAAEEQILYFTTSSLDTADEHLWFLSDRSGDINIHILDLGTGGVRQLSDNRAGRQWQYQGFDGTPGQGLAVWSMALDAPRGLLYFIQDDRIRCVDRDGVSRILATVPPGQTTAFIDVSDCGRWLCVPTTDDRALLAPTGDGGIAPGGAQAIDRRCQEEGLNSFLRIYDTENGALAQCIAVPRCWITHVQFRPGRPEQILYNHEWPSMVGVRRMWLWDGHRHRCLRPTGDGRSADDWACHEVWAPAGDKVVYHGGYRQEHHAGAALVGLWDSTDDSLHEIALPAGWKRYGHFQIGPKREDLLVCDGYYEEADDEAGNGRWLSLQTVDWQTGSLDWHPLCRHGSPWRDQDDHPHPIFDHAGKHIYFTGGTDAGHRAVYRIGVPAELR